MKRLALLVLVVGCSYRERSRAIHPSDVGSMAAVITNYLSAPRRFGSPTEDTPGGISREAIVDEAHLEAVTPGHACVLLVERTHVDLDMPLSDWNMTLGGATVNPSDERVTVRDRSYRGERDVVVADAVTPTMLAGLRVTQPTDEVYRVFERTARACGPVSGNKIVLEVERPMDDHRGGWGETFVWTVN